MTHISEHMRTLSGKSIRVIMHGSELGLVNW